MNNTPTAPKTMKPKHMHHSDARVVLSRPMIVTAGGSQSHAPIQSARLVMAGNPKPILDGLPGYTPIIIKLDWPDMGIPAMTAKDWVWLAGRIKSLRRPLHVSCAMGHGRTGTCLALLAYFWGQVPRGADPVAWVRDRYCADAIETASQIAYVELMTGRKSKCKAKEPVYATGVTYTSPGYAGGAYGAEYGAEWTSHTKDGKEHLSRKPSSYFPQNDASKALATGQYNSLVRYCGQTTKGILCPKPAREGLTLCDKHYMEAYPDPATTDSGDSKRTGPTTWSDPTEGA